MKKVIIFIFSIFLSTESISQKLEFDFSLLANYRNRSTEDKISRRNIDIISSFNNHITESSQIYDDITIKSGDSSIVFNRATLDFFIKEKISKIIAGQCEIIPFDTSQNVLTLMDVPRLTTLEYKFTDKEIFRKVFFDTIYTPIFQTLNSKITKEENKLYYNRNNIKNYPLIFNPLLDSLENLPNSSKKLIIYMNFVKFYFKNRIYEDTICRKYLKFNYVNKVNEPFFKNVSDFLDQIDTGIIDKQDVNNRIESIFIIEKYCRDLQADDLAFKFCFKLYKEAELLAESKDSILNFIDYETYQLFKRTYTFEGNKLAKERIFLAAERCRKNNNTRLAMFYYLLYINSYSDLVTKFGIKYYETLPVGNEYIEEGEVNILLSIFENSILRKAYQNEDLELVALYHLSLALKANIRERNYHSKTYAGLYLRYLFFKVVDVENNTRFFDVGGLCADYCNYLYTQDLYDDGIRTYKKILNKNLGASEREIVISDFIRFIGWFTTTEKSKTLQGDLAYIEGYIQINHLRLYNLPYLYNLINGVKYNHYSFMGIRDSIYKYGFYMNSNQDKMVTNSNIIAFYKQEKIINEEAQKRRIQNENFTNYIIWLCIGIIFVIIIFVYIYQIRNRDQKINEAILKNQAAIANLSPHFVANFMNEHPTILRELGVTQIDALNFIEATKELFSKAYAASNSEESKIEGDYELYLVRQLILVHNKRNVGRNKYKLNIDDETEFIIKHYLTMPPLIFFSCIENAIKYSSDGIINFSSKVEKNFIQIILSNKFDRNKFDSTKTGHKIIHALCNYSRKVNKIDIDFSTAIQPETNVYFAIFTFKIK